MKVHVLTALLSVCIFSPIGTLSSAAKDDWKPPLYSKEVIAKFASKELTAGGEPVEVPCNPYDPKCKYTPPVDKGKDAVCAVVYEDESKRDVYSLLSFENEEAVAKAGFAAHITHKGNCAACSTTKDLAVYLSGDLTTPVRKCGFKGFASKTWAMKCLLNLGLTKECAEVWYWNTVNTRQHCFSVCMVSWIKNEPFNKPDGSLNDCLQCDEDMSGPIFKRMSGRTRRNSGLISEIIRPGDQLYHVVHNYQ